MPSACTAVATTGRSIKTFYEYQNGDNPLKTFVLYGSAARRVRHFFFW